MTKDEALKMALEALEDVQDMMTTSDWFNERVQAVRQALDQLPDTTKMIDEPPNSLTDVVEPELVAWMFQHEETGLTECVDAQQVEWGFEKNNPRWQKIYPLYTTPPKREWVGLTDEEIGALTVFDGLHHVEVPLLADFARSIESKLKEKNQ